MKNIKTKKAVLTGFLFSVGMISFAVGIGCKNPPSGILPGGSASSPSCVWTPLDSAYSPIDGSGANVIRNATEWHAAFFPNATPLSTPPVDFSQWMVVGAPALFSCNYQSQVITSVCVYSNHIEMDTAAPTPTPVSPSNTPVAYCSSIIRGMVLAAVPQSNLPLIINPTPTATP
jgi:hypothetical protein